MNASIKIKLSICIAVMTAIAAICACSQVSNKMEGKYTQDWSYKEDSKTFINTRVFDIQSGYADLFTIDKGGNKIDTPL
jgi:hypothetical protein